jgi:hypothetical protein
MGQTVPTFRQLGGGVELSHREFITDITCSTLFSLASYPINPGLSNIFPWLAAVASNFEEYEMKGLVFEFRPTSGSAISSSSSALGTVILATDYNVLSPNFLNKQQMESYEFSTSVVPFNAALHPVECAPGSNPLRTMYIRYSAVAAGADARMYDMGNFQIATVGMQSAYVVGELWVSYHVVLKKPRSYAYTVGLGNINHFYNSISSTGTTTNPFGVTSVLSPQSDLAEVSIYGPLPGRSVLFSFPGSYMCVLSITGTASITGATITLGANLNASPNYSNNSSSAVGFGNSTLFLGVYTLTVLAAGVGSANIATVSATGGSALNTDLYVFPITAALY